MISPVFRVAQIGKALQDQQWLFESLMVQVEERRSAVENNAKQIEDRSVQPLPASQLAMHFKYIWMQVVSFTKFVQYILKLIL